MSRSSHIDLIRPTLTRQDYLARGLSGVMKFLSYAFTLAILVVLGLITFYLGYLGISSLSLDFFTMLPTADPSAPGGMRNGIAGTAILVGIASLVGIPLGMLAGVFLSEYEQESRLATPVRFVSDVLSGVPSIVVGVLGYELLVAPAAARFPMWVNLPYFGEIRGFNGWAGAATLAFIMIPIVARTTEEMLRLVPGSYREAAIALGATKARTILGVVIPSATGSVVTGIMLAIARVAGETAPLLFTALGSRFLETDPRNPFPSLTLQIFDYAGRNTPEERNLAWAGTIVLIFLIFALNLSIRYFTSRGKR